MYINWTICSRRRHSMYDKPTKTNSSRQRVGTRAIAALIIWLLPAWALATTTINHQFTPASISQGDSSVYRITIANTETVPLLNADVTTLFPAEVTIADAPGVNDTCGFNVDSAVPGDTGLVLTSGTVPQGDGVSDGVCYFEITVGSTTPGNHVVTIPANTTPTPLASGYTAFQETVQIWNTTPANATLAVAGLLDPTGSKTFTPSVGVTGDSLTLDITLTNPNGSSTLPLTSFTDNLPPGMEVASPAAASVSCTGTGAANGVVTATPGATSVTLTGGVIGEGGVCTVSVQVVMPAIVGASQSFTNTVAADAIGNTRGLSSSGFSRDLTVNSPIDVSKSFNPDSIPAGQPARLSIVIDNNSTANTLDIDSFVDNLAGTTLSIVDSANGAPADPTAVCDGSGAGNGVLTDAANAALVQGSTSIKLAGATAGRRSGANGKCTIAYVTSTTDGTHTNAIPADTVVNTAGHASPAATDNITVNAQLTVDKAVSVNQVAPGQWTEFTVSINNWSGAQVANVSFRDTLPASGGSQMVLDDSAGIPVSQSAGCSSFTWTSVDGDPELVGDGGTVAAGAGATPGTCTIRFRARLPDTATTGLTFTNQIPTWDGAGNGIGGIGIGPGGQVVNPNPSPGVNVTSVSSVALNKSFLQDPIAQGQSSTLRLRIRNRTLGDLTNVNLTDTLPAGLELAADPAASNGCNGDLQAFPGGNQIVLTGGSLTPRPDSSVDTYCTIQVQVTGSIVGVYTNTIEPTDFSSSAGTVPNSVSDTLRITAGVTASKEFSPTATASGGRARIVINVVNQSNGALTNVAVNDSGFSAGLSVASPANASTSCGGSPVLVATPGATGAQMLGAALPAGGNCDFSFDGVTGGAGPWSNTIPIGNITSAEGPFNSSAVSATLNAASVSIGINKSFNPVIVTGGVPSVLTIDVINSSSSTVTGVSFTDVFPDGIIVYATPDASTNCTGGTVTAVPEDGMVSLVGATLQPNNTCQVYVTTTSIKFLNLTNFIPAMVIVSDQGITNALPTTASLSTLQGLGVAKGFEPAYIAPNEVSRLKIRLVSTFDPNAVSPTTLTGVSVTDSLPSGLVFAAVPNAATTCTGAGLFVNDITQTITLTGGNLQPGTNCEIAVNVTSPVLGTYNNVIPERSIITDQGITNEDPGSADLNVVELPSVSKSFNPATVNLGEETRLTVTLVNNAPVELTGVTLTDSMPAGFSVSAAPDTSTNCSNGIVTAFNADDQVVLSGATIPSGGNCNFQVDVVGSAAGQSTNTVGADAIQTDQGISNPAPANADITVLEPPGMQKTFSPASIATDGISLLTISLINDNAEDITLTAALVDALPGNVVVATTPNVVSTCPGTVNATAGATSVSYASGSAIPAGGCSIALDVTSSVDGGYVNTIAAGQLQTTTGINPDPAVATLGVGQMAAPSVNKGFNPATIDVDGVSRLTIILDNPNTGNITLNGEFRDIFPANLVVADPPDIGTTCPGTVTADAGTDFVAYANGSVIPAGGCSISLDVTSNLVGSYNNGIAAGDLSTDAGSNPEPATAGAGGAVFGTSHVTENHQPGHH